MVSPARAPRGAGGPRSIAPEEGVETGIQEGAARQGGIAP